jgi:hypothetical protein
MDGSSARWVTDASRASREIVLIGIEIDMETQRSVDLGRGMAGVSFEGRR